MYVAVATIAEMRLLVRQKTAKKETTHSNEYPEMATNSNK
jgi:hypothetical protein